MNTFNSINSGETGHSVRGKLNQVLSEITGGSEGINAIWNRLDSLHQYINAMDGGVGGLIKDTSYDPSSLDPHKNITLLALGPGTFSNLKDAWGRPIIITPVNSFTIFFREAGTEYWQYATTTVDPSVGATLKDTFEETAESAQMTKDGNPIYPITKTDLVFSSQGENLTDIIKNIQRVSSGSVDVSAIDSLWKQTGIYCLTSGEPLEGAPIISVGFLVVFHDSLGKNCHQRLIGNYKDPNYGYISPTDSSYQTWVRRVSLHPSLSSRGEWTPWERDRDDLSDIMDNIEGLKSPISPLIISSGHLQLRYGEGLQVKDGKLCVTGASGEGDNTSVKVDILEGSEGLKNFSEWAEVEERLDTMTEDISQNQSDICDIKDTLQLTQGKLDKNTADIESALRDAKSALDSANSAALDAADAKLRFEEIADDEIISVAEKQALRTELARVKADYVDIESELAQYDVENEETLWTDYENAYIAFKEDLETKINTPGNVSVGNLLSLQDTYYAKRSLLLTKIYVAVKALADKANEAVTLVEKSVLDVQEDVNTANTVAGEAKSAAEQAKEDADRAQSAADAAQGVADKADAKFDAWSADNVISPVERKSVRDELAFVVADYNDIQNQITKYELQDTEDDESITNFSIYYNKYKGNLEYVLNPANGEDGVVVIPSDMNNNQDGYYAARTTLLSRIAAVAKAIADRAITIAERAEEKAKEIDEIRDNITAQIETLEDKMVGVEGNIGEINARLDGVVENHFLSGAPTLTTSPVTDWKTDQEKINHVGDTYTNINEYYKEDGVTVNDEEAGRSWRWCYCTEDVRPNIEVDDNGIRRYMHWHRIADSDAVKALLEASKAMTNADGKARTFVTKDQPKPPYDEGDLWLQGPEGDIMVCKKGVHRAEGTTGSIDDWEKAGKYVDNDGLEEFFDGAFSEAIEDIQNQIDKKAETWYQEEDPALQWTTKDKKDLHLGDLWYKPSAEKNYMYSLLDPSGYGWKEIDGVPDGVYDYVDTKAQIFVSANKPSAPYNINDLWIKLVDNEATDIYRCVESKTTKGSEEDNDWKLASYYTDNAKVAAFIRDTYGKELEGLRNQIDGKAETWYQANDPAISWTQEEKAKHEGDLWYNTTSQQNYIYGKTDDGQYAWSPLHSVPEELYDVLDAKAQVFVGETVPATPYYERDLWIVLDKEGNATVIKRSTKDRIIGVGVDSDWVGACNYATKDEVDKNTTEVARRFESLESNVESAAEKLKDVYTKAEADGKIDEAEAEAIAQAKADLDKAKNELEKYTNNQIDGLATGSQNLLVNSGFTGGFEVVALNSGSTLKQMFEMFSPSLEYWNHQQVEVRTSESTQTGKEARLYGSMSSLSQTIIHDIYAEKDYVVSFGAKGTSVDVYFGGVMTTIRLTANWNRYVWKLKTAASFTDKTLRFVSTSSMSIGDIKLEEGTIPSEWSISPYDNRSTMAKFEEGAYLQELLKVPNKISTDSGFIETGVLNAGIIQMGDYAGGVMTKVTAGMSGNYENAHSVAFFGGGNYAQAIATVGKYRTNPQYQPTQEELAEMAKIVLTHGGRAILQDAIVRGSIYAENGYFKGRVEANEGYFKGTVEASAVYTKTKTLVVPSGEDTEYVIGETHDDPIYPFYTCEQYVNQSFRGTIILPLASKYLGMELSFLPTRKPNSTLEYSSWTLLGAVNGYDDHGNERLDPIMIIPKSGYTPSFQNYAYQMNSDFKVRRFVATLYSGTAVWMELRENS